jgi:repressor LexA
MEGDSMDNKEIGRRIYETRKSLGFTLDDVANRIGVAKSTVQRYETGRIGTIKLPVISAIADALGVNDAWLIGKSDKKYITDADRFWAFAQEFNKKHFPDVHEISTVSLPVLGEISCGKPKFMNECYEVYTSALTNVRADFILVAKGDSMTGARINDGDLVFIRQQPEVENGEIAAVAIGDEATLKRFYRYDNDLLVLRAENPDYADQVYRGADLATVKVLGKAVAFQSNLR